MKNIKGAFPVSRLGPCSLALCVLIALSGDPAQPEETQSNQPNPAHIPVSPPADASGHARMINLLKDIAHRTRGDIPFLGDGMVKLLDRRLAELGPETPYTDVLYLRAQLGEAEVQRGNIKQGIQHLVEVYRGVELLKQKGYLAPDEMAYLNAVYRLGVAYMRLGETQNCCRRRLPESCILPIRGGGIHDIQDGSREAIKYFTLVLRNAPENSPLYLSAKWLLNVMYMTIDGYPEQVPPRFVIDAGLFESEELFPRFRNRAPDLGLDTFDLAGGAIVDDFTGDDYLDIVVSTWDPSGQMRFFINNRDGTFSDATEKANLNGLTGGLNLAHADYDNDGDLDILVLRGAWLRKWGRVPNSLLRNNGDATFTDVTFEAGLGEDHFPAQAGAWADYDKDGDVDLYIGNESIGDSIPPSNLFRNNGDGTFTDVAGEAGVPNFHHAKAACWGDIDGDGFPDLYISNFQAENRLYRNNADGTFTDVAQRLGVTTPRRSFPLWFWDFDNDGALDLYVSSYGGELDALVAGQLDIPIDNELARLYRGDGQGGFADVAQEQNLKRLTLPMAANFGDLDNDGYLDYYLGTGYPDYEALMPNVMVRNRGGTGFSDVTFAGGFGHLQKGHGIAFADLDNDGDQDVFEQMGGFFPGDKFSNALFENPGFGNHWISVKLVGVDSNRAAIGARIRVEVIDNGDRRSIYKHVNSGASFGANPLRQTIGLGKATRIEVLEVYWPATGRTQTFRDLPVDQFIRIVESEDRYTPLELNRISLGGKPTDQ